MEKLSAVTVRTPSLEMMQKWVEKYICGVNHRQGVVGSGERKDKFRKDDFGNPVTDLMFRNRSRWAHVCPFVRDSMDYDLFGIEESKLDDRDEGKIVELLRRQIPLFIGWEIRFDPVASGTAATLPVLWKTFLTFFPYTRNESRGSLDMMDRIHSKLKSEFVKAGLMLGQFYPGCKTEAIYNSSWKGPLISPYPAFAIRYMAIHDHLFINPESAEFKQYLKFFPRSSKN